MRSTNGGFLRDAAIAGLGVVILPSFILHGAVRDGRLQPVLTRYRWPSVAINVVYPQTRHLSARARALIDALRAGLGSRPDWEAFIDASRFRRFLIILPHLCRQAARLSAAQARA